MTQLIPKNMTPLTPEQYATEWSNSSDDHQRFSDYGWISSHLSDAEFVLEIGCGNGNCTKAILKQGAKVVSIEINNHLLNATAKKLEEDYKVTILKLSEISNISINSETDCYLIEADIFDSTLDTIFKNIDFDHVLFSFFGAAPEHAAKGLGKTLESLDNQYASRYREQGTTRAYEIAKTLNENCKLVVVDRVTQPTEFSLQEIKDFYQNDLAERLAIPANTITVEMRKNEAILRPTKSKLNYMHNGSFNKMPGKPFIACSII